MKKILLITILIMLLIININTVLALEVNNFELGYLGSMSGSHNCFFLFESDVPNIYNGLSCREAYLGSIKYNDDNGFYIQTTNATEFEFNSIDKSYTTSSRFYFETIQEMNDKMVLASKDLKYNGLTMINKNFDAEILIKHNSRIQVTNNAPSILYDRFNLTIPTNIKGEVLVTDSSGKFIEQISIGVNNGPTLEIEIPQGNTVNLYFQFDFLYMDTVITYNIFSNNRHFTVKQDKPLYEIIGQQIYEINGFDNITEQPYFMPKQSRALVLIKEETNIVGNYKTKDYIIEKNEKFYLPKNKISVFQFQHPAASSVMVESNFEIKSSAETIPILPKEVIDALIEEAYGGGVVDAPSTQDTILVATPNQSIKINRLGLSEDLISKMVDTYIETIIGTTGKIEWFGKNINWKPTGDEPIEKKMQRDITSTMDNKQKRTSIGQYEYVIYTANTGSIKIRIPGKYKLNEDYTIEVLKNYTISSEYEDDFIATNPTIPDFGDTNDIYSKDINENMYDWITGNSGYDGSTTGELGLPSITNIGEQITSFTDMFLIPIKNLFTGIPELYSLIIFGFGLGIVMFVLGR